MILKTRAVEHLQFMASVPPERGGFSVEQNHILGMLPTAQKLLLSKKNSEPLHAAIGCEAPCGRHQRIAFSFVRQLGSSVPCVVFKSTESKLSPWLLEFTDRFDIVVQKLEDRLASIILNQTRRHTDQFFQMFQRIRLYRCQVKNFARIGSWLWFTTFNDDGTGVQRLGCLRMVLRWGLSVTVVIQEATCTAESIPVAGFKAQRVELQDVFRLVSDERAQTTFRLASVHHDCVRTKLRNNGEVLCGMDNGSFRHAADSGFFVNPTLHSVRRL